MSEGYSFNTIDVEWNEERIPLNDFLGDLDEDVAALLAEPASREHANDGEAASAMMAQIGHLMEKLTALDDALRS